ncbi:MAG: arginine repressor [Oscillospiraceae bacterium]|nr:arginine repressor [Oscillospiraceae bacterium]
MSIRKVRQNKIISLIEDFPISTQDELIEKLREYDFDVTQATVSRDIKELKLIKKIGPSGKSIYAISKNDSEALLSKYQAIFEGSVISVDYAINTCVIKTHNGMANAACAAIDAMKWEGVIGTIAGDDTIFVLCRTEENAAAFCTAVKEIIDD